MSISERYGKRLIPQIIDDLAATEPDRILYSIANSADISQPFQEVTARAFTSAVDNTAWWLQERLGKCSKIEAVGYIGPHDLRHIILTFACAKANRTALFLSPKNSTEGAVAVLKSADCKVWVQPQEQPLSNLIQDVLERHAMQVLDFPRLDEMLDVPTVKPFPYDKSFEEATQEPFCLLHTSGSTGLPKPIPWKHGLIGTMDAVRLLPPVEGDNGLQPWTEDWKDGDRIYSTFPMSHGAGIIMNILMPALFRLHCILGPAHVIPNITLVDSMAEFGKVDIWSMIPSIVDEVGETPDVLAKFTSSKFICASGGPVSPISASKVNEVIRVLNLTGTTEGLFIGNLVPTREDWLYFAFHPFSGFEFKQVEPGVYEHWIHRNEHWDLFNGYFHTFPDLQTVNIKDLYVQHPTKPYLWAYKGRNDDVVVLSNGYKISPLDTEALITTHPAIDGCLMIGSGKTQAGLLIELKDPAAPRNNELFESIWSIVERANSLSLHKNQLHRDYVAFTEPDKPFVRTDKRTIKRRATMEIYADFVERFYASRQEDLDAGLNVNIDADSVQSITDGICQILKFLSPSFNNVTPNDDVFRMGLDSLLVVRVIKFVRAATGLGSQLAAKHLYKNPTVAQFAETVTQIAKQKKSSGDDTLAQNQINASEEEEFAKLSKILQRYDARRTEKMNEFDVMNSNYYIGQLFYLPLSEGLSFQKAYSVLQEGLKRTIEFIPALEGKMMDCSEQEIGYKKGSRCISFPHPRSANSPVNPNYPEQMTFKDLSSDLPSFEELQKEGFVPGQYYDSVFNDTSGFPQLPDDVFNARANFVKGGCVLAINLHHQCSDGVGALILMRVWAECCRYVMGDKSATCDWLHPDSFNHNLLYAISEYEGRARPAKEIGDEVWKNVAFNKPEPNQSATVVAPPKPTSTSEPADPFAIYRDKHNRILSTNTFLISSDNLKKLQQEAGTNQPGPATSIIDLVQALYWRTALRARYRVAVEREGHTFAPTDMAIVELPVDARPYFSSLLPTSYIGSLWISNRTKLPIAELCSPDTSIAHIARVFRDAAKSFTPSMVHDVFTLLQTVDDYSVNNLVNRGINTMNGMMNNMALFPLKEIEFGEGLFGNGGVPEAMRIQMDRLNIAVRMMLINPVRKDGGIELTLGTFPEELEMILQDIEFMKYVTHVGGLKQ